MGQVLASGTTSLDASISLAGYVGQIVPLTFIATDANQQTASVIRNVYVYADGHFTVIANVPGTVQDFDGTRVLYVDSANALRIRTLGGSDVFVYSSSQGPPRGVLTPIGAVFQIVNPLSTTDYNLYEYAEGTTSVIGDVRDNAWAVNGSYFVWVDASNTLTLRDFTNGTNTPIAAITPRLSSFFGADVSPHGDVAYGIGENGVIKIKFVPKGGTTISVTDTGRSQYPQTDGTTIVYTKGDGGQFAAWSAATGEILLGSPIQNAFFSPTSYPINNGWFLYATDGPPQNNFQVWSVSPTGAASQVSKFAITSSPKGLGANGEVVYSSGAYLYLSVPPYNTETLIGPANVANVVWRNGHLYALVAASVVQVQ